MTILRPDIVAILVGSLLTMLAVTYIYVRTGKGTLRLMPALAACDDALRSAAEKGTSLFLNPGGTAIQFTRSPAAITGMFMATQELIKHLSKLAGPLGVRVVVVSGVPFYIILARDNSEIGYREGGHPEMYSTDNIQYIAGSTITYLYSKISNEKPAALLNIGWGGGSGVANLIEPVLRYGGTVITGDVWPEEMACGIPGSDYCSFGEETQAMGVFLSTDEYRRSGLAAEDLPKIFMIGSVLVLGVLYALKIKVLG